MTSPTEPLLQLQGLRATVDGIVLFEEISASVAAGQCLQIASEIELCTETLLSIICGQLSPAAGAVLIDQQPPNSGQICAVLNESDFAQDRPVGPQIIERIGAARADDLLSELALRHRVGHEPWAMSAGEFRRIEIATACAQSPVVLVVQEPERRLDRAGVDHTTLMLAAAKRRGTALVISTIDDGVADRIVDQVLVLPPLI